MKVHRRKVWLIDGSVAVTGAFVSARDMARALRDNVDVVLVLPRGSRIEQADLGDFVGVRYLPLRPLRRSLSGIVLYLPCLFWAAAWLRWLMARERADGLLINDFYLMQGALVRLLGYRGQIVTWVRIAPSAFGRIARLWLWAAARTSDCIIAVSQHIKQLLPDNIPSRLLYDPVSDEFLSAPTPLDGLRSGFVFVGNYIPGKGQDVALEALAELLRVCPDQHLRFHGGDMGLEKNRIYRRSLESLAERLGVSSAVTFGEFAQSPRLVLQDALAALNLSRSESFSRTVLEASACGLPVVSTRCGGPEEIVEDGKTGFLIPIDDAQACAEAMISLCKTPNMAAQMGVAGRARVIKVFAPQAFRSELLDVLNGRA